MRILRVVLLLPVALTALVGCSPADEPLTALAVRDGKPTVLLVTCGSLSASITLREDETRSSAPSTGASPSASGPGPSNTGPSPSTEATSADLYPSWSVRTSEPDPVNEIVLFGSTPPNWKVDDTTLTRLEPGVWYVISGYSSPDSIRVRFTTDVFDKLDADHVLAPVSFRKQKIMTRATFERNAKKACENS